MALVMDHVSRPLLIALVAVVGLAGVWMMVLRPKAESGGEGAAPAAPVGAVAPAPGAAKVPPAEKPAPAPAPRATPAATGTTVLLITGRGADDVAARAVVRQVDGPGVRTVVTPIERVGEYKDLTGSVEIPSTPTILVIGADRRAQRIVGLPDERQVQQAVAAARSR